MSTFGQRLKQLRCEHNLTQDELAKSIKISKSSLNMYERDEREPKFETLEAIADYFNVDMDYLLGRSNSRHLTEIKSLLSSLTTVFNNSVKEIGALSGTTMKPIADIAEIPNKTLETITTVVDKAIEAINSSPPEIQKDMYEKLIKAIQDIEKENIRAKKNLKSSIDDSNSSECFSEEELRFLLDK